MDEAAGRGVSAEVHVGTLSEFARCIGHQESGSHSSDLV